MTRQYHFDSMEEAQSLDNNGPTQVDQEEAHYWFTIREFEDLLKTYPVGKIIKDMNKYCDGEVMENIRQYYIAN